MRFRKEDLKTGLLATLVSLVFVCFGVGLVVRHVVHRSVWRETTGTITQLDGLDAESDEVKLTYEYTVGGQTYTGEMSASDTDSDAERVRALAGRKTIQVRYNPRDPASSEVLARPSAASLGMAMFALPFLLIGVNHLWRGQPGAQELRRTQGARTAPPRPPSLLHQLGATALPGR